MGAILSTLPKLSLYEPLKLGFFFIEPHFTIPTSDGDIILSKHDRPPTLIPHPSPTATTPEVRNYLYAILTYRPHGLSPSAIRHLVTQWCGTGDELRQRARDYFEGKEQNMPWWHGVECGFLGLDYSGHVDLGLNGYKIAGMTDMEKARGALVDVLGELLVKEGAGSVGLEELFFRDKLFWLGEFEEVTE